LIILLTPKFVFYLAGLSAERTQKQKENKDDASEGSTDGHVIPLFCKIRICEDGSDMSKATEDFCRGEAQAQYGVWGTGYRCRVRV
jgi:hypothetical protein